MAKDRGLDAISEKLLRNSDILHATAQKLLEKPGALSVLEIGCGAGRALMELVLRLKDAPVQFYGINKKCGDPLASSADLLRTARQYNLADENELGKIAPPELFFYDATQLHFAGESLDLIYSVDTIRFIVCKAEFLEEVCRVLKPGGVALLHFGSSGWKYPYSLAQDNAMLTPHNSRLVLKHGGELIPFEVFFKLFEEEGFLFELINLPAFVIRIAKQTSGKLALRLSYDPVLSMSMTELPYGDESFGKAKGGFRSVYHLDGKDYQTLFARGWLSKESRLTAEAAAEAFVQQARRASEEDGYNGVASLAPPNAFQVTAKKFAVEQFQPGQRIKVKGKRKNGLLFHAVSVRPDDDNEERDTFEGRIEWIDPAMQSFGLLGFSVYAGEKFSIKGQNDRPVSFADLVPGMMLKVKGQYVEGRIIAERVKIKTTPSIIVEEIQGRAQEIDPGNRSFKLFGFWVKEASV
jgi:SAM-dependent methyltransferase